MLDILLQVYNRPNPQIQIGNVDSAVALVLCDAEAPDHKLLNFGVTPPGSGFFSSIETSLISLKSHDIILPLPEYRDQCQDVGERCPIFLEVRKSHSGLAT